MANQNSSFQPDSDVHITYEDQQKINKFARHNARLDDLKEELKGKQNEYKNLEEASEELILMDDDSDEKIPYFMGEVFVYQDLENTQKTVEDAKTKILDEIKTLETRSSDIRSVMSDLKTQLYGKFGNHINLEAEED
ncbi:Probable prefoldin subunit 4 [Gryllus bimaculatus]|nr:Probable prefoldin subunit 4 [Gryllus bimaculatus]